MMWVFLLPQTPVERVVLDDVLRIDGLRQMTISTSRAYRKVLRKTIIRVCTQGCQPGLVLFEPWRTWEF